MRNLLRNHFGFLIVITLFTLILGFKLITHPTPFFDWDESIYMQVGKEMIRNHSLLLTYQGQPWLEKPFLAPLVYGLTAALPFNDDISTRIVTLILTVIAISLLYMVFMKATKNKIISIVVIIVTLFNPVVLQRAQVVNTDVFLVIGWLGYLLFYRNFWQGLLFLFIGVMSKSILGFYPLIMVFLYELYQYITHKKKRELFIFIKYAVIQSICMSLWYLAMIGIYGNTFIQVHFFDHLVKRVTKSIESHFGARTFYIDIIIQQYGLLTIIMMGGFVLLVGQLIKKVITPLQFFLSTALIPWFLFLNLTKTKIAWYIYPAIPQLVYLLIYPLILLRSQKIIFSIIAVFIIGYTLYINFVTTNIFATQYSSYDDVYKLAMTAKNNCSDIVYVVNANDRKTQEVLASLGLLISTSEIYGNHPSLIYYFDKPVTIIYDVQQLPTILARTHAGDCVVEDVHDTTSLPANLHKIHEFGPLNLYNKVQ